MKHNKKLVIAIITVIIATTYVFLEFSLLPKAMSASGISVGKKWFFEKRKLERNALHFKKNVALESFKTKERIDS